MPFQSTLCKRKAQYNRSDNGMCNDEHLNKNDTNLGCEEKGEERQLAGSVKQKVDPFPGSDVTQIRPP